MYYKLGADHLEYEPDFVAETTDCIHMLEAKARDDIQDAEVQAKKDAAVHRSRFSSRRWASLTPPLSQRERGCKVRQWRLPSLSWHLCPEEKEYR